MEKGEYIMMDIDVLYEIVRVSSHKLVLVDFGFEQRVYLVEGDFIIPGFNSVNAELQHGYDITNLIPSLQQKGITEQNIETMIRNKRTISFSTRYPYIYFTEVRDRENF